MKKQRSKGKCSYCSEPGHNRRTCKKLIEVANLSKFIYFARALLINMVHVINYCFCCVGQEAARTSFMTG
jgi:hypothetical protein